jgi:hypothetical protein
MRIFEHYREQWNKKRIAAEHIPDPDNQSPAERCAELEQQLAEARAECEHWQTVATSLQDILDGRSHTVTEVVEAFERLERGEGMDMDEFFDKQKEVGR